MATKKKKSSYVGTTGTTYYGSGNGVYTPTVAPPTRPPYGSYDPTLDQGERSAGRGLQDLIDDIGRANQRGSADYELGKGDLERSRSRGKFDLNDQKADYERGFGRSLADLLTSRTRGGQDYQRSVAGLDRDYSQLARKQGEGANAAGVQSSGLAAKAAQIRGQNKAFDRAPLDTNYQRFSADSSSSENRLREDRGDFLTGWGESSRRLNEDVDLGLGRLALDYTRGVEDRNMVQLPRAQRENTMYGQDVNEIRIAQAKAADLLPDYDYGYTESTASKAKKKKRKVPLNQQSAYGRLR